MSCPIVEGEFHKHVPFTRGRFLVVEGTEGSGKSRLIEALEAHYAKEWTVHCLRYPLCENRFQRHVERFAAGPVTITMNRDRLRLVQARMRDEIAALLRDPQVVVICEGYAHGDFAHACAGGIVATPDAYIRDPENRVILAPDRVYLIHGDPTAFLIRKRPDAPPEEMAYQRRVEMYYDAAHFLEPDIIVAASGLIAPEALQQHAVAMFDRAATCTLHAPLKTLWRNSLASLAEEEQFHDYITTHRFSV